MRHPDFRIRGTVFATLGYPSDDYGVLMFSRQEQRRLVSANPRAFSAVKAPGAAEATRRFAWKMWILRRSARQWLSHSAMQSQSLADRRANRNDEPPRFDAFSSFVIEESSQQSRRTDI